MKISEISDGDFDPVSGTLKINGIDASGNSVGVELPIASRQDFLGWLTAVFGESEMKSETSASAFIASRVAFGIHDKTSGHYAVSFTFDLTTGGRIRIAAPIPAQSESRLQAIQGHLNQALREMGAAETPTRQ